MCEQDRARRVGDEDSGCVVQLGETLEKLVDVLWRVRDVDGLDEPSQ